MKPIGFSLLFGLGASAASLGAMSLQTLVDRSPFAPPQAAGSSGAPQAEAGTLEFRGMVVDALGTSYSVFDATASRSHWVREGQDGPIKLKSYDAQESMLEIEQNGKPVKLQLKRATIQTGSPMITPTPMAAGAPQPGGGPALNQPGAQPQADAKRLEAVAAEVRRRRALRNAAANPGAPKPPQAQPAARHSAAKPLIIWLSFILRYGFDRFWSPSRLTFSFTNPPLSFLPC